MKKILSLFLSFVLLICCFGNTVFATSINENEDATLVEHSKYTYPISPTRTPEIWSLFESHSEMIVACEIPEKILTNLTTQQLIKTCLDYPLAGDMLFYNDYLTGFEIVKNHHNGLTELYSREDLSANLVMFYDGLSADCEKNQLSSSLMQQLFSFTMTKYAIDNNLITPADAQKILEQCENILSLLATESDNYKFFEQLSNELELKLRDVEAVDYRTTGDAYIIADGTIYWFEYTTVETPQGTTVNGYYYLSDLITSTKTLLQEEMTRIYPNATVLADPTLYYNCHSYAWHSASTSNHVWIDDPSAYMTDGSYTHIGTIATGLPYPSGAVRGNRAFYDNIDDSYNHSAVIYNSTLYTSKWGMGPLTRHAQAYCPYYYDTTQIKIYSRNY